MCFSGKSLKTNDGVSAFMGMRDCGYTNVEIKYFSDEKSKFVEKGSNEKLMLDTILTYEYFILLTFLSSIYFMFHLLVRPLNN